ncbi:MAG: glutathione synthase [Candidatus Omnitrophica bacterium]|nr:glutathione synthase [Candidatus Omnitrophota bacterium]
MKIFCVLDPLHKLDPKWDTTLYLLREMSRRGHRIWIGDVPDLAFYQRAVVARSREISPHDPNANILKTNADFLFKAITKPETLDLRLFDLILIRKEPPFDENYLCMTYLLDHLAKKIPIVNHPRGIRNTNEKLGALLFPDFIPPSIVSSSPASILEFQKSKESHLVIKPIAEKGGKGVFLLKKNQPGKIVKLKNATLRNKKFLVAQKFLKTPRQADKRILILNGKIFAAYEKRPAPKEFRANLGLGGSFHRTRITPKEEKIAKTMRPYLLQEGLYFVGIDVMGEFLLEINVTCPAGLPEAKYLHPRLPLVEMWADFLESHVRKF